MSLYAVSVTRNIDGATAEIEVEADTVEQAKRSASAKARYNAAAYFPAIVPSFHSQAAVVKRLDADALVPDPKKRARKTVARSPRVASSDFRKRHRTVER